MPDDLERLADDLETAGERVYAESRKVVSKGALNVKNEWRRNAVRSAGAHGKHYPDSITYDIEQHPEQMAVDAVIGPDKDRPQGALGNLIEFGSTNNPPNNDGGRALRKEAPRFEKAMADLGEKAIS